MNKHALIELALSTGRFLWFGFLGLLVTALTAVASDGAIVNATVELYGQTFHVGTLLVAAIGFAAKAVDRYVHKNKNIKANGLAPF